MRTGDSRYRIRYAHMISTPNPTRRPGSVTVISAMLAFLAVAGFGNAVVWNQREVIAAASRYGLAVGGWTHTSILVVGAVAALASSVGLWRMASWARASVIVWCASVVAFDAWVIQSGLLRSAGTASTNTLVIATVVILGGIYGFLAVTLGWSRSKSRSRLP
jgi:uncharacterized membrane protein (DUF2068 family)